VLAERLLRSFVDNGSADWPWGEDIVTYDNARLPQALIAAGAYLGKDDMRDHGLRSLKWLFEIQTDPQGGHLSLIGNNGWLKRKGKRARFDQQPMDATAPGVAEMDCTRQESTKTRELNRPSRG
jgi:hypothetical protein